MNIIRGHEPKILVVGSCSVDLVLTTSQHPLPNETVLATSSESFFGGKGANQAVGTSRLGSSVYFIGCVGMDPLGQQILRNLVDENVNVGFVKESEEASTGTAYVNSANGKNSIIVNPAANFCIKTADISAAEKLFHTCDIILIQLEIPMEVVEATVKMAKKYNKKVVIYAAPARKLSAEIVELTDFIIAKSSELKKVFEEDTSDHLLRKYPNKLFVRDDTNSTSYFNGTEMHYFRNDHDDMSFKMGMGDAFTSGFAVALCHGNNIDECVKFGNDVSLKVAKNRGSQQGLPYLKDFI